MTADPRVSVVIVTYNSARVIDRCLESLREHESDSVEVIVVDNASSDDTRERIEKRFPSVRLLTRPANEGLSAGINVGVAASHAPLVFLLNPDTHMTQPVLSALADFVDRDIKMGAAGPKLLNEDGTLQPSCRRYPTLWLVFFHRTSGLNRLLPGNPVARDYLMSDFDHDSERDVDWLSGAALMVRRSALEAIGGMDEGYFLYFEDVDLCHRLHDAGYRVVYYPKVELVHYIGKSSGRLSNHTLVERHKAMWRYWRTYKKGHPLTDVVAGAVIAFRGAAYVTLNTLLGLRR
jgi:N-acetylglucosaminyl-diphospho-decaprenol L-rhamnosyltransferase